jgi:hypothetical protein
LEEIMKKSILNTAIAAAMGASVMAAAPVANAGVASYDWTGLFTMLDPGGGALANTSGAKGTNTFQTAVTGTMQFDTVTGAGTATVVPFDFFKGTSPAEAVGINMQAIGDGMGGAGSLVLGNMLFNWNGTNGIPVSIVLDAQGFFAGDLGGGGLGAAPASDGTYTDATYGYLSVGPVPIATTAWNTTTNGAAALGNSVSGVLPLIYDTTPNAAYDTINTGGTIGGSPMIAGPFSGNNANFDVVTMSSTGFDAGATLPPNCNFDPSGGLCTPPPTVPVPAAVWLFGSGLLGLVGVARRRKLS